MFFPKLGLLITLRKRSVATHVLFLRLAILTLQFVEVREPTNDRSWRPEPSDIQHRNIATVSTDVRDTTMLEVVGKSCW